MSDLDDGAVSDMPVDFDSTRPPASPAPPGWWWSARRCPRCTGLVLERITPRGESVVSVHQLHCRRCDWSEATPL